MNNHERQKTLTSSPAKPSICAVWRCDWQCSQHLILGTSSQLAYDALRLLHLWSSTTFSAWIVLFPVSFYVGSDHLGVGDAENPVLGKRCRIIKPHTLGKTQNFPFYWIQYWSTRKSFSFPTKGAFPSIFELQVEPCLVIEVHLLVVSIFLSYHVQAHILSALNARKRKPLICKKFLLKCAQTDTKAQAIYMNQLNGTPCP